MENNTNNGVNNGVLTKAYKERIKRRRHIIKSFEAKHNKGRTLFEKWADVVTDFCGSIKFFMFNALGFSLWILFNTIPFFPHFDPYPFGMLTMMVSLEAIFLSIFVLMSQNRQAKIADLREEIDLQVNMISESEITKIIHLVAGLYNGLKINLTKDPELKRMMKPLDTEQIEKILEDQIHHR